MPYIVFGPLVRPSGGQAQSLFVMPLIFPGQEEVMRLVKGKMGKTYHCDICGQEVKVTKEGVGVLVCCNKPMREL